MLCFHTLHIPRTPTTTCSHPLTHPLGTIVVIGRNECNVMSNAVLCYPLHIPHCLYPHCRPLSPHVPLSHLVSPPPSPPLFPPSRCLTPPPHPLVTLSHLCHPPSPHPLVTPSHPLSPLLTLCHVVVSQGAPWTLTAPLPTPPPPPSSTPSPPPPPPPAATTTISMSPSTWPHRYPRQLRLGVCLRWVSHPLYLFFTSSNRQFNTFSSSNTPNHLPFHLPSHSPSHTPPSHPHPLTHTLFTPPHPTLSLTFSPPVSSCVAQW